MADPANRGQNPQPIPIVEGVTATERYLARLCKRSFLSLWSYPGVYKDQGRFEGKGDGKEVCDLLVVFENHILIFSDKDCRFGSTKSLEVEWRRWYKKAVRDSARQVWGAERWIKEFPNRLFLDRKCTFPFPINFPSPDKAIFHRIVVAHDDLRACAEVLGGSGSLMLSNMIRGDEHLNMPFMIGLIDPSKGYVHVFDDTSLDIVMSTLDTITDFVTYLTKKEQFLTGKRFVRVAGEEELLAVFLGRMNDQGQHDFAIDGECDALMIQEGFWESFRKSPERIAQIDADRISYTWDEIIEKFAFYAMTGTQYFSGGPLREQEVAFRFLAMESRTRRRMLATSLHEVLARSMKNSGPLEARVMEPSPPATSPHYVFLTLKRKEGLTDEQYRAIRIRLLSNYCRVAKLKFPKAIDIVGLATEGGRDERRSEDIVYANTSRWSEKDQAAARKIQEEFGLLKKVRREQSRDYEYPVDHKGRPRNREPNRNSPCTCGSGKRYKRCHGDSREKRRS